MAKYSALSLFSGGGIGDLALRSAGARLLVACELRTDRAQLLKQNFPEAAVVEGDIQEQVQEIVRIAREKLHGEELDVLFATPPCQGMSKNGRGKLLSAIRRGEKPKHDHRNELIIPALSIAQRLHPKIVVFENVPEMEQTLIPTEDGTVKSILDVVAEKLGSEYAGNWEVVEFANFGVPQRRQRLITVFSRIEPLRTILSAGGEFLPPGTHSKDGKGQQRWVTVSEALRGVPPLDAASKITAEDPELPFHRVPLLDRDKYFWVSNTPEGRGAFDNQCVNPTCRYQANPVHGSRKDVGGINRANKDTPVRCVKCGELLPRPWVHDGEDYRLMSGFTSAYKRMSGHLPASALTRNMSYACSDQKLHPSEHRVLSLHEAFIIHTLDQYDYVWGREDGRRVSDKTIREVIGESIPPKGLEVIFRAILETIDKGDMSKVRGRYSLRKQGVIAFS